jgi:CheY-like chemotaxis protein/HPt (histidine-containing phosphotransfer) domain-containing protein
MKENILHDKKVLVVDDNVINQMVVKHSLIKLGASTDIAGDGQEAIVQFKKAPYDLVLMDIQMPNMDGYDTTRYIRNQFKSNIPIIAMTAFALKGEDEKCFESGMNGYVPKPFTLESLYNAISQVFNSGRTMPANPNILTRGDAVVDISMLYEIAGNDEDYIKTMIYAFVENLPMVIAKMEAAYAKGDWQGVFKSAHYAKSSLSVIKIPDIFDWVLAIEGKAKNEVNMQDIPGHLRNIKQKFAIAENILKEKFSFKTESSIA